VGEVGTILRPPFSADGGAAWMVLLPPELHSLTDTDTKACGSPLRLLEDGVALGAGHAVHQRIRDSGSGLYSFWKKGLWFSTSDGSDPNTNRRTYSVVQENLDGKLVPPTRSAAAPAMSIAQVTEMKPGAAAQHIETAGPAPLQTQSGLLCTVFGDRQLANCPVCHSPDTAPLWRMPMANLREPISLFGGYFNQVPTLQIPSVMYCFDFCRTCESIFLNPVPSRQKEQYRTTSHYVRKMETPAEWKGYEDVYDSFAKWIPQHATVMIDAACGVGQYLQVARRRGTHQWQRMVGLELAEKYVEHMRDSGLEAYAFDIDNDDLLTLVEPNSVDFITFCEAFEHVERPLDALRKLVAVLRQQGRLYFTAQRYGTDVQAAVRPGEPIYIGEKVVSELPEQVGCRIVSMSTSGMRYYIVLEK
jgi:2-polyprenyl-3-methyl-5-hydroxy-6-metoxy-1,4-benzoquinol methylase